MRIVASLVVLAGCDVLFQFQDVHPPIDGRDIDAFEPDAKPIPPMLCPFPSGWTMADVGSGTFYTVDAALTTAVFEISPHIYVTTPGSASTATEPFSTLTGLRAPRLAPSGTELFMHSSAPCCSLVVSKLEGAMWTAPTPITVKGLTIGADELPGIPSAGMGAKRRMIISVSGTDMFWEAVEEADGWDVVFNYKEANFGMSQMQDANLSPDGYRMFFGGKKAPATTATPEKVWAVDRTDLAVMFDGANVVELHSSQQSTLSIRAPYVTPDCQTLWLSIGTNPGMIRRGIAQ